MTDATKDRMRAEIARWITPILMCVVGYFAVDRLGDIKKSTDAIPDIQTHVALLTQHANSSDAQVDRLGSRVDTLASQVGALDKRVSVMDAETMRVGLPWKHHQRAEPGTP